MSESKTDTTSTIAVLDFETATQDPASACAVGWAVVASEQGEWVVAESDGELVRPPKNAYADTNIEVHGIEPPMTEHSPSLAEVWDQQVRPRLLNANARWLSAYNAPFDAPVLWASLQGICNGEEEVLLPWQVRSLLRGPDGEIWKMGCLLRTAGSKVKGTPTKRLDDLCVHLGIEQLAKHDASDDSYAAAELLSRLLNQGDEGLPSFIDNVYGSWIEFTRSGPVPTERSRLTNKPTSILSGVTSDGRIHQRALDKERSLSGRP